MEKVRIPFNVNSFVEFRINDKGKKLLPAHTTRRPDGRYMLQMWEFMKVFGEHMVAGKEPPFDLEVFITVPRETLM